MKKIILLTVLALFLNTAGSCGYKFAGGGLLPGKTKRVTVKMFENNTSESGVENIFANALSVEITAKSDSEVVSIEDSDAYFKGIVKSISISTLTRTADDAVIERKITAVIDLKMVDNEGNLLWFIKDFQGREEYMVTTENLTDMASRTKELTKIAERMAQKVVSIMLDDF